MYEMIEQQTKLMQKTASLWQQMVASAIVLRRPETSLGEMLNPWLSGIRATNELNVAAWKVLIDGSEDVFFKMLKESRSYSQAVEVQLRESWVNFKKAQTSQRDAVEEFLKKMDTLVNQKDQPVRSVSD
jgi:hypothetical protein